MSELETLVLKAKVCREKGDVRMFDRIMYRIFLILSDGDKTGAED